MKIRLGYVSVPLSIDDITYCKTITHTNYEKLNPITANQRLQDLITLNFHNLEAVLYYNFVNNIHFFRLSHNIIPLATHNEVQFDYALPFIDNWKKIGSLLKKYQLRIDTHPDQFCVLNSENKEVVKNSIDILKFHREMWDLMNYDGKSILHVGGGTKDKCAALKRFKKQFLLLPRSIQKMIIVENDDKIFTAEDVLNLCEELKIPMVLDYHHYRCHHNEEKIEELLPRIVKTWENTSFHPKMHYSSPKNKRDFRSHSEYINSDEFIEFLSVIREIGSDIDIMLECKAKDIALFRLVRELKFKTNIKFIDDTTLIL